MKVGVIGAGTMGVGIAQVAAQNGHQVYLVDLNQELVDNAKIGHVKVFERLVEKGSMTKEETVTILNMIRYSATINDLKDCRLVIEAISENLEVKHKVFTELESIVAENCILASNTSSFSIASIGSVLKKSDRVIGIHFFNPAPLMPLVEIIPAIQTSAQTIESCKELIASWKKTVVLCKDTPGFIVNRVARPFYGEALRIYEEGIADFATIDWAMTHFGGFKMGPFMLMDFIGNDVNYTVTESVFESFFFDPRFKPSFTQKRYYEAGFFGRKSGRGYYSYVDGVDLPKPMEDTELGKQIFDRILSMLINEAVDVVLMQVATPEGVDLAMMKGTNYPKGLLKWADDIGLEKVLLQLEDLFSEYGEDRYRPNPLLRRMVRENKSFFQ
jgi:3-hydroxybutyryl-CoA dehydrogenase